VPAREPGSGLYVLGVTGGIGSGKSTVAAILERAGARVLDADRIVAGLYRGGDLVTAIVDRFGPEVATPAGGVNRKTLGRIVFADAAARRDLEALVHPAVRRTIEAGLTELRVAGFRGLAVIDAALLVEAEPPYPLDALLVVSAPEEARLARLEARGVPGDEGRRRMAAQTDDARRRERADAVLENVGPLEALADALRTVLAGIPGFPPALLP
jgi:dephospho-CoA kinase